MTAIDGAHQPHLNLVETPPVPPAPAASPTGRRVGMYSPTWDEAEESLPHRPRHRRPESLPEQPFRLDRA